MKAILRILLGLVFLVSGFVKAVDAVGFSFKLEEYFSPSVFNIPFLEKQALLLAIAVIILELLLGLMLLLKIRLKFTLAALIALCVFFAFLTFYSAYYNKVTDCGCFGDALKLSPWQSFFKDLVLLILLVVTWFLYQKNFHLLLRRSPSKYVVFSIATLLLVFEIGYGIFHEPIIDFRDYKIGTDLRAEKAAIEKNPSEYKTFYTLKNSKTGETITINQDDFVNEKKYWEEGTAWTIEEGKTTSKIVKEGYSSEISKFKPENTEGVELTNEILTAPHAILLFSYHPKEVNADLVAKTEAKINTNKTALKLGISTEPNTFKTIENALMDGTAIKTIARSNPFVLELRNGKIVDKKSASDYLK